MPGPFPGMDPYLEQPVLWSGVHQGIITGIRDALNAALPAGYVSDIGERVVLMRPERSIFPDVVTFTQTPSAPLVSPPSRLATETRGVSAVAEREIADAPLTVDIDVIEAREVFVEVRPVGAETEVVAVIEVLSPINKTSSHPTRDRYQAKQRSLLDSAVSLIEIDLLRTGDYTVAVPEYALRSRLPQWDYLICLHRGGQQGERDRFEVWTPTVRDRLPRITVPLLPGIPDVILDLQMVFDRTMTAARICAAWIIAAIRSLRSIATMRSGLTRSCANAASVLECCQKFLAVKKEPRGPACACSQRTCRFDLPARFGR